uniref:Glycine N-acyltransferase-like protein n=1 Tax=Magallana gigas TaxID=29159 RepID=K1PZ77_MAGGI
MAVREVLPEEYDDLDQKLEKELPLSICGLVHFRLMRRKHLLTEKMVLVDSWPDFSVLVILDRQYLAHAKPEHVKFTSLTIPDGFKISELNGRHTEIVHKSWPFINSPEKWTNYQITHFPSVSIETEDGRPVAWEVQHEYGAVGALHVEPEYRRSKFGSVVTRTLAEKMTKDGQLVFALVRENNDRSIAFHESNGYVRMPFKFSIMSYFGEAKE